MSPPRMIVINLFKKLQLKYPELKHTKLRFVSKRHAGISLGMPKTAVGCYDQNSNCIYIIADTEKYWLYDSITLVHEVAHAIIYKRNIQCIHSHGPEWQAIASELCLHRYQIFWSSEIRMTRTQTAKILNRKFYSFDKKDMSQDSSYIDVCNFVKKYKLKEGRTR